VPASGSQTPSMAFAVRTSARLPLGPPLGGLELTTLVRPRNITLATDRSVVPPRFEPGLSTTHGGVPTGDPDISPGQTYPGWLPQLSLVHIMSSGYSPSAMGARAAGHTFPCSAPAPMPGSRLLHAGHRLGSKQVAPRLHPEDAHIPRFRCRQSISTLHRRFASARLPDPHLTRSNALPFPATLSTPTLNRRTLRWFATTPCRATTEDLPPSLVQHRKQHPQHVTGRSSRSWHT